MAQTPMSVVDMEPHLKDILGSVPSTLTTVRDSLPRNRDTNQHIIPEDCSTEIDTSPKTHPNPGSVETLLPMQDGYHIQSYI